MMNSILSKIQFFNNLPNKQPGKQIVRNEAKSENK